MLIVHLGVIFFGCLLIRIEAQNTTSPLDFINSMKTSFEAAGAGAIKLGPMGLLGDMNGQFGMKVNKEATTSGTASAIVRKVRNGRLLSALGMKNGMGYKSLIHGTKTSLSKEDPKNCFGRYGRQPIIIPIIVQTTTAATTTTTAGLKCRYMRTKKNYDAPVYRGVQQYNQLPLSIIDLTSRNVFKEDFKNYIEV